MVYNLHRMTNECLTGSEQLSTERFKALARLSEAMWHLQVNKPFP